MLYIWHELTNKTLDQLSDRDLTQMIANEDQNAYRMLFEKYAPRIYSFSLNFLGNKNDAEELVQDAFLKIWEKRNILNSSQNIKAFIFKITTNILYDFVRHKNIEHAFEDYARLNYTINENYTWHEIIFREMKQNLDSLVAQMPEQQQIIFRLSKLDGFTNEEIAQKLNLSKRTVENHLYRALSFLKKQLKKESFVFLLFSYLFCG